MRLRILTLIAFFLFLLTASAQQNVDVDGRASSSTAIYFETASADLSPAAVEQLQTLIEQIQGMGDYRLEVAAHTDSRGTSRYNDELARSRAQSVADFLNQQGITTDGMQTLAFGESLAGNDENSADKQRENRRVDVIVSGWYWQGIGSLQDSLANPLVQHFQFKAEEDQLLSGDKGGRFFFTANSFETLDGEEVTGPIDFQLTECYSLGDMISMGLTTTAQDRILESGGMLRLTATRDGEPLQLKAGYSIGASVPTPEFRENMSLFYGQGHEEAEGEMDWVNSEAPVQSELPKLRLAKAPLRPIKATFELRYMQQNDEVDPRIPREPDMTKPVRPREPNYDRIEYHPQGLQKLLMSKAERDRRTAEKREERRQRYDTAIERYEERSLEYYRRWNKYQEDASDYAALRAKEINAQGVLISGPLYEKYKAIVDSAYLQAMIKYKVDSTRYEGYRNYKLAQYEKQVEALGMVDAGSVANYFFNINRMGWANIDRFYKEQQTTMLAAREADDMTGQEAMVFLMIPERNIILRMPYRADKGYILSRVPVGEKAKVLAFKVKDQKAFVASQEIIITEDIILALNYRPGRLRDIRSELDMI